MTAVATLPLAAMGTTSLLSFPQLHHEHMPSTGTDRGYAVEFMADKDECVALFEVAVFLHGAVCLERRKLPAFELGAGVRKHDVNRNERAGIEVRREWQRAAGLDGMVLNTTNTERRPQRVA